MREYFKKHHFFAICLPWLIAALGCLVLALDKNNTMIETFEYLLLVFMLLLLIFIFFLYFIKYYLQQRRLNKDERYILECFIKKYNELSTELSSADDEKKMILDDELGHYSATCYDVLTGSTRIGVDFLDNLDYLEYDFLKSDVNEIKKIFFKYYDSRGHIKNRKDKR